MPVEKHYSGQEAAKLLGLSYDTMLELAQTGEIATVRVGRRRLYPESGLNAYLERHKEGGIVVDLTSRLPSPKRKGR